MKVNFEVVKKALCTVGEYAKAGCAIAVPIVVATLCEKGANRAISKIQYGGKVGYDDAVKAILDSSMYSDAKKKAVSLLKKDGDVEYYRAVAYITQTAMYSDAKVELIADLSKDEKIEQIEEKAQA